MEPNIVESGLEEGFVTLGRECPVFYLESLPGLGMDRTGPAKAVLLWRVTRVLVSVG